MRVPPRRLETCIDWGEGGALPERRPRPPFFERLAQAITHATGSARAFGLALGVVAVWAVTGPIFGFSDTWQLVINTGTTIVTFLMVFLVQQSQNKDSLAIQLKLNELVAALDGSSNRLINVEDLSEHDLQVLQAHYRRLASMAKESANIGESHSIEEAERRHRRKTGTHKKSA
jgi:low affinity Fe/Cu permease